MAGEAAEATAEKGEQSTGSGIVSRVLFVLLVLPVIVVYPLQSIRKSSDELTESFEESPLQAVPKVGAGSVLVPLLYAVVFVGLMYGLAGLAAGTAPGIGVVGYTVVLVASTLIGVGIAFSVYASGMERELAQRIGVGLIASLVIAGWVVAYLWYVTRLPVGVLVGTRSVSAAPATVAFLGTMAANGYLVKSEEIRQNRKRGDGDVDSKSFVQTSRRRGEELPDSKGQQIIESFAENRWVVPDDLPTKASVKSTRKIDTYRDIVRGLWVEETTYRKTVPETKFSNEKSKHRSDYDNRRNVAPSGFSSKTYTYYVPGSRETETCDQCKGHGELDCTKCRTRGSVTCGTCNGSGKNECRKCRGSGRLTVEETCGVCRGSGETSSGWECNNCGGYGSVETTKGCPECNRRGTVSCSTCSGTGEVTCDSCGGRGTHDCEKCDACGRLASFKYVERSYTPDTDVSHQNKTVPVSVIEDADGKLVDKETDNSPSQKGLYRRQDERRRIPVVTAIYEYLGDEWEIFRVEGDVEAVDFPRDFGKQFRIVQGLTLVSLPVLLVAVL